MKYLCILLLITVGCGSTLEFTPNGHRLLFKSKNSELSCYTNNCCYPYKEKVMVCIQTDVDFTGFNSSTIVVKYIPDNN